MTLVQSGGGRGERRQANAAGSRIESDLEGSQTNGEVTRDMISRNLPGLATRTGRNDGPRFGMWESPARSASGPPAERPGLLRIEEAAKWLGLIKRKTYELLTRGDIQSVYIGRSRRITVAALQHFVDGLANHRD